MFNCGTLFVIGLFLGLIKVWFVVVFFFGDMMMLDMMFGFLMRMVLDNFSEIDFFFLDEVWGEMTFFFLFFSRIVWEVGLGLVFNGVFCLFLLMSLGWEGSYFFWIIKVLGETGCFFLFLLSDWDVMICNVLLALVWGEFIVLGDLFWFSSRVLGCLFFFFLGMMSVVIGKLVLEVVWEEGWFFWYFSRNFFKGRMVFSFVSVFFFK